MRHRLIPVIVSTLLMAGCAHRQAEERRESVNSIAMTLVRIEPGSFDMGVDSVPLPPALTQGVSGASWDRPDGNGDYDEVPVHRVTISRPFSISQTEVTIEQFRAFRPDYQGNPYWSPYAAGVSWNDAAAFCAWLSKKEGKPYRLPTEAEWEFACRAGTRTPFAAGVQPDEAGVANAWGVKNMQASVPEWCLDWWARYPSAPQTDPIGPATGILKVVRGGALDHRVSKIDGGKFFPAESPYYRRSANRACCAADFASSQGHIGFRVVQAPMPASAPLVPEPNFFTTAIKQNTPDLKVGPDPSKPYYRTRPLFPNLGERDMRAVGWKIGLPTGLGQAYHNSALQMCPNGDLIAAYYNTLRWEDEIDQSILTMRLRYGSDEWDIPEPWPDYTDGADAAPIFWNDRDGDGGGTMWLFWGAPRMLSAPPFQFMTSRDNGATWSRARTPVINGPIGKYTPQPVNSIVRDRDGTIYVPVDGAGADTALFATSDHGKTWRDTGGRTAGRHTSFILGKDGTIVGYGGKNSNIDGRMPRSVSTDGGKTYANTKTEFMPLAGGQRPSVIRLASGRLFFVADTLSSRVPGGRNASFIALSDDEGATWTRRELPIASTCGYVTATQTPNGVIHIVTSKTKPVALHIEMNETWALHGGAPTADPTTVRDVRIETEASAQWSGGIADDGNYRLHGTQTFHYPDGRKQWESSYAAGKRVGTETWWAPNGKKKWERIFDGSRGWTWRVFGDDGNLRAQSTWKGKTLIDPPATQPATQPASVRLIQPERVKHYIDAFNQADVERVVNLIPNAKTWEWMFDQVPLFECPDKDLEKIYYFRWWTYRKHIKQLDYICLTEFLPRNPVSSAVGHHVMEGRWIHDNLYLDQDLLYWLRGKDGKPHDPQNFSSWTVWAAYQRYLVNGDKSFIVGLLDDFLRDYQGWESKRRAPEGTYWQFESRDAMEDSINGDRRAENRRPSISSYMYGNAQAIAAVATLAGKPDLAAEYTAKAAAIKQAVQEQLWDPQAKFFKVRWKDGPLSDAREAIGFIPWYFELPDRDRGYEEAWRQLTDPAGFWAPMGLTTAERRHPGFRTHGTGHSCEWDGPVWPFATAQTLTAMANVLNDYPQSGITKEDYLKSLQVYARSHTLDGQPYIGEYLDETTGRWLRTDKERGRHYNHSTFCDLVISGLVGVRPRADDTIQIHPLLPESAGWDFFCLDNVRYHGRRLTIVWDRTGQRYGQRAGLTILSDGKPIAHSPQLKPLSAALQ